ncbi:hypothetical protein CB452P1_000040 [Clostridium phage CB452P1]|nr:hypothetical protein CB452P1_000040 [Clostridium phage CB452P1]
MKELKLSDKTLEVLYDFSNCIDLETIKKLKKSDGNLSDLKYSIEEYDEMFQEIFDIIVDIKGEC